MIKIENCYNVFYGEHKLYIRDDEEIVGRYYFGRVELQPRFRVRRDITIAQALRYWRKHFPGRESEDLPEDLQRVIGYCVESPEFTYKVDRKGREIWYTTWS